MEGESGEQVGENHMEENSGKRKENNSDGRHEAKPERKHRTVSNWHHHIKASCASGHEEGRCRKVTHCVPPVALRQMLVMLQPISDFPRGQILEAGDNLPETVRARIAN